MMKEKFALISVYNKNGLKNLCSSFFKNNIKMVPARRSENDSQNDWKPLRRVKSVFPTKKPEIRELLSGSTPKLMKSHRNSEKRFCNFAQTICFAAADWWGFMISGKFPKITQNLTISALNACSILILAKMWKLLQNT